jgi:hypothetical protein
MVFHPVIGAHVKPRALSTGCGRVDLPPDEALFMRGNQGSYNVTADPVPAIAQ